MKLQSWLLGAAVALPCAAQAESPNYTYLQGQYIATGEVRVSGDTSGGLATGGDDYDGFSVGGSLGLTQNLFATGEYNNIQGDDSGDGDDYYTVGLGLHSSLTGKEDASLDLFGVASFDGTNVGNYKAQGYGLTGGMRWQATHNLEIAAHVGYVDYGDVDDFDVDLDGIRYGLDGIYNVTDLFAVTLGYRAQKLDAKGNIGSVDFDLDNQINVGVRIYPTK